MTALPSALSLTNIPDGANIVASDHRNNYSAIQTLNNALISILGAGVSGQVLTSGGGAAVSWSNTTVRVTKTAAKTWNTSSAESTDLLESQISIPAGPGVSGSWRLTLFMDMLNNTGGAVTWTWRLKAGSGPTTLFNTGAVVTLAASATRRPVRLVLEGMNLGAANSQAWNVLLMSANSGITDAFTTGEGEQLDSGNFGGFATSALDTASAQPVILTVQHSSALATAETKLTGAVLEVGTSTP